MRPAEDTFLEAQETLAHHIRELRLARGLSQEELADRAGCDRTYIGMLERRKGNPSLRVMVAIATALGVSVGSLCGNIGDVSNNVPGDRL